MSNAGNLPPAGYQRLPEGVRCRCVMLWMDVSGAHWCCRSKSRADGAALPFTQDFRYALADLLSDLNKRRPEAIDAAAEVITFFRAHGLAAVEHDPKQDRSTEDE